METEGDEVRGEERVRGEGGNLMYYCSPLLDRPLKMSLTLEENIEILGRRNPFRMEYKVRVTSAYLSAI